MKTVGDVIYSDKAVSPAKYVLSWVVLLALLVLTWRAAYSRLGDWNLIIALGIALVKCAVVLWYFMELRSAPKLAMLFFAMALVMVFMAATLTLSDYFTRWQERLEPALSRHSPLSISGSLRLNVIPAIAHLIPIDDIPKRLHVFRPPILVFEIVGVFPQIENQQRS